MSQTGPAATISCTVGARTDRGVQRTSNEDAFAVLDGVARRSSVYYNPAVDLLEEPTR